MCDLRLNSRKGPHQWLGGAQVHMQVKMWSVLPWAALTPGTPQCRWKPINGGKNYQTDEHFLHISGFSQPQGNVM